MAKQKRDNDYYMQRLKKDRPDLYREALRELGVALPGANAKVEGALKAATPVGSAGASLILGPDGFFDGATFDPDHVGAYMDSQRAPRAST